MPRRAKPSLEKRGDAAAVLCGSKKRKKRISRRATPKDGSGKKKTERGSRGGSTKLREKRKDLEFLDAKKDKNGLKRKGGKGKKKL